MFGKDAWKLGSRRNKGPHPSSLAVSNRFGGWGGGIPPFRFGRDSALEVRHVADFTRKNNLLFRNLTQLYTHESCRSEWSCTIADSISFWHGSIVMLAKLEGKVSDKREPLATEVGIIHHLPSIKRISQLHLPSGEKLSNTSANISNTVITIFELHQDIFYTQPRSVVTLVDTPPIIITSRPVIVTRSKPQICRHQQIPNPPPTPSSAPCAASTIP